MKALKQLEEFSDIIESIEIIEYSEDEHVSKIKIKLKLLDASVLWIREVEIHRMVIAYSYYWLRQDGSTIIGWDNAPHHKEVETFPHHKHIGKKDIEPSQQTDIKKVMSFIKDFLN